MPETMTALVTSFDDHSLLRVTSPSARRTMEHFTAWQVVRASDGAPWAPGDRLTLYRVPPRRFARSDAAIRFRVCFAPVLRERKAGERYCRMDLILRAAASGDLVTLAESTMRVIVKGKDGFCSELGV